MAGRLVFSKPYYSFNKIEFRTITNLQPSLNPQANLQPSLNSVPNSNAVIRKPNKKPIAKNKIVIDGVKLHWEKFGNGTHVALMLPGLVGSIKDNFLPVTKKMNLEKYTLIGWDPPGYGKSRPPDRDVFTEEFCLLRDAKLASALMKELGYSKFSTIGWSNGGITGALIAGNFPETVDKVVICNSPLQFSNHIAKIMEIMVDLETWTPSQRKALLRTYERSYAQRMLNDWKKFAEENNGSEKFHTFLHGELRKVQQPTLYIKSMEDIIIPLEDSVGYGKFIQDFKLHKVPKGGHDHLEFVDEFVAATDSFLSS